MKAEWTNKDVLTQSETTGLNSKAILVVDIGNHDSDYYYIDYTVRKKETGDASLIGCKVNLRPLPEKMSWGHTADYIYGWNECLDQITGVTE